jgi:hypothetical protein
MKKTDSFTYTSKFGTVYNDCFFEISSYTTTGNHAISIFNEEEGMICTCTVNAQRVNEPDEIGVKNYSENEGMVDFLIGMGIIEKKPFTFEHSGFVMIPYFKLTDSGLELVNS